MRQLKFKGFTLIELLIVVAIIAILAAIAVPNFLEAQIRSKVSKAKTDMRTMATGLEAYFVDQNTYVPCFVPCAALRPLGVVGVNSTLPSVGDDDQGNPKGAKGRITVQTHNPGNVNSLGFSMTTPIAYLTSLTNDPFADTRGSTFGYWNAFDAGWITWSYGPDTDENSDIFNNGQIQHWLASKGKEGTAILGLAQDIATAATTADVGGQASDDDKAKEVYLKETVYNPFLTNPSVALTADGIRSSIDALNMHAYTYDATNGSTSIGDVWRVKQ